MHALDKLHVAMTVGNGANARLGEYRPVSQAKCFFDFKKEYALDVFGGRLRKVVVNADKYVIAREFDYVRAQQGTGEEPNPLLYLDNWYANAVGGKALLFIPPLPARPIQKIAL